MIRPFPHSDEIRLRELRAKRKTLWRQFEDNPNETHLAAKLKIIDDQIAQPNEQIDHEANDINEGSVEPGPDVGRLFLLLALCQRRGS